MDRVSVGIDGVDRFSKMTHIDARAASEAAFGQFGEVAKRERVEQYRLDRTAEFVDRYAGGVRGKRVLELGCSFGVNLVMMKRLGAAQTVGVDYFVFPDVASNDFTVQSEAFDAAQQVWKKEGIEVVKHDLANPLPFPDGSFDLVISNAVIEHMHGIHQHVFREAYRVLAAGGSFVFTTPNLASLLKRVRFALGRSPNWNIDDYFTSGRNFTGHVREFTVAECRRMLDLTGFRSLRVVAKTGYFKWRWLWNPRKAHHFAFQALARLSSSLGDLIYASGQKRK